MNLRFGVLAISLVLVGCPSKDSSQASSSGSTTPGPGGGTGPLAQLEAAPFMQEMWLANEGGQQLPMIYYARENVRVSAQCRNAAGQFMCDAVRQLRGAPVDIQKRTLTGNISAGTRVCMKLGRQIVGAHNAQGGEDGFCRMNDGSLVSNGALEQYAMRVTE